MSDRSLRSAFILVGLAVVGLVTWMTLEQLSAPRRAAAPVDAGAPPADAGAALEALDAAPASAEEVDAGALEALALPEAGTLPQGAPRTVHLGVVLVQFAGAEGASPNARPRGEAAALAERLAADARTDFKRAVQSGDPGSSEDIGRIPRGVLDPRTEVSVFSLSPGAISDVLETPRGYWIVKRID